MTKWVIADYNVNEFIKSLKAMAKVGPELHIESYGMSGIKLQTTNTARSVYFQIIYKSEYFQDHDSDSQQSSYSSVPCNQKCKIPLKYLIKCSSGNMAKVVDRIQFELSDLTFIYTIFGNHGWVKTFTFNVFDADNLTTHYDMADRVPFLKCPISGTLNLITIFNDHRQSLRVLLFNV